MSDWQRRMMRALGWAGESTEPLAPGHEDGPAAYRDALEAEGRHWGAHLSVESGREWYAWLDHPRVLAHYRQRASLDGLPWEEWVAARLGGRIERSLELGCGAGSRSLSLAERGLCKRIEGFDVSAERIARAEAERERLGFAGSFRFGDANHPRFEAGAYDLVFSCHSFHHFLRLESILEEVRRSLRPGGLFVLEEFVGPTQFQWTDLQIEVTRGLLALLPPHLRRLRWGATKELEGRPTVEEVVAVSPFESIRSAEIEPLFRQYFEVVAHRLLGGTLQHLLYNGIVHNFAPSDADADRTIDAICSIEDALVDRGLVPSDFMLLIGASQA